MNICAKPREKGNRWVENEAQKNENILNMVPGSGVVGTRGFAGVVVNGAGELTDIPLDPSQVRQNFGNQVTNEQYQLNLGQNSRTLTSNRQNIENIKPRWKAASTKTPMRTLPQLIKVQALVRAQPNKAQAFKSPAGKILGAKVFPVCPF
jgi:hypothetical protein